MVIFHSYDDYIRNADRLYDFTKWPMMYHGDGWGSNFVAQQDEGDQDCATSIHTSTGTIQNIKKNQTWKHPKHDGEKNFTIFLSTLPLIGDFPASHVWLPEFNDFPEQVCWWFHWFHLQVKITKFLTESCVASWKPGSRTFPAHKMWLRVTTWTNIFKSVQPMRLNNFKTSGGESQRNPTILADSGIHFCWAQ